MLSMVARPPRYGSDQEVERDLLGEEPGENPAPEVFVRARSGDAAGPVPDEENDPKPPTRESRAAGSKPEAQQHSRRKRDSIRIGWQFATNSYRSSPEPVDVLLGFLLRSLADLIGRLGADLVVEQMLEREPGAGQIEQNLIEAALRVRSGWRTVL